MDSKYNETTFNQLYEQYEKKNEDSEKKIININLGGNKII